MRKEFIVERQGRSFCLYAGLLELAHEQGLRSIRTELIQAPTDSNNRVAICSATVVLDRDGIQKEFTGLGDAAPNNVTPAMQSCLLRMAETRAKARALRDAVNIGVTAFEELGDDETYDGSAGRSGSNASARGARPERGGAPGRGSAAGSAPNAGRLSQSSRRSVESAGEVSNREFGDRSTSDGAQNGAATEKQVQAIRSLCRRQSIDADRLASERCGAATVESLSHAQASELIRELNGRAGGRSPGAA